MMNKFTLLSILAILFSMLTCGTAAVALDHTLLQTDSRFYDSGARGCFIWKWCTRGRSGYRFRCKRRIACPTPTSSPTSTVSETPSMSASVSASPSASASVTPSASPSASITPSVSPSPSTSPGFVVSSGVLDATNPPNTVFLDNTDVAVGDKVILTNFMVTGGSTFQLPDTDIPIAAVTTGSDSFTECTSGLLSAFPSAGIRVMKEVVLVEDRLAVQLTVTTARIQPEPTPMPLATPCPVINYSFDVVPL